MVQTLEQLYQRPDVLSEIEARGGADSRIGRILTSQVLTAEVPHQNALYSVDSLDTLFLEDNDAWYEVRNAAVELPADVIAETYGHETLFWAAAHPGNSITALRLQAGLKDRGIDTLLFAKTLQWLSRNYRTTNGREVINQYRLMDFIAHSDLRSIDLENHLLTTAKEGVTLDRKRLDDYSLIPLISRTSESGQAKGWYYDNDNEPTVNYMMWLDTPSGIALTYKGRPQAIVGVTATRENQLIISQIQGVKAKRVNRNKETFHKDYIVSELSARGLMPLRWQETLIHIVDDIAHQLGFTALGVQSSANNPWTVPQKFLNETHPPLDPELAARHYDQPAERLGFTRDSNNNWHKEL